MEVGRTEVIMNNLSPWWQKSFALDYYFESVQWLRFDVCDTICKIYETTARSYFIRAALTATTAATPHVST